MVGISPSTTNFNPLDSFWDPPAYHSGELYHNCIGHHQVVNLFDTFSHLLQNAVSYGRHILHRAVTAQQSWPFKILIIRWQ